MQNTLLIVDGHNLLFQMFYGMPNKIYSPTGKPIHGTLGFVGALIKIINMVKPTHAVVLFDSEHHNTRNDLLPEYKQNRPDFSLLEEDETPFSQLEDIYKALDLLDIKHTEATDCETDDVVAAYALTCRANSKVVISSFDSDFFQLIDENVSILRYRGKNTTIIDHKAFCDSFGISPERYADFKSLTGDNADNVKGADHIGPKTAAKLICEFDNLQNLIACADDITPQRIKDSVTACAERLKVNYQIIKLDGRAKLPFSFDSLKFTYNGFTTTYILKKLGLK